jgi:hypothetical protein
MRVRMFEENAGNTHSSGFLSRKATEGLNGYYFMFIYIFIYC